MKPPVPNKTDISSTGDLKPGERVSLLIELKDVPSVRCGAIGEVLEIFPEDQVAVRFPGSPGSRIRLLKSMVERVR